MKTRPLSGLRHATRLQASLVTLFVTFGLPVISRAADVVKANNTTALDTAASWTGAALPASTDVALFTNGSGATAPIGTGLTVAGLRYTNAAAYNITVGTGALTVGASGIDLSAATANHTISAPLVLNASQEWNVANGRALTISGATGFNQSTSAVSLNRTGSVTFSPTFGTAANASANGPITVNGGTLSLTTGNTTGFPSLTNILSPLTPLTLGGGIFSASVGNSVGTYTQNLGGLTIAAGASTATQARGSSSLVVVNFGTISRSVGGTLNLTPTSNNSGFRTTTANVNGMQSGGITLNSNDFAQATNATTNIGAATYVNDTWAAANKTTVTADTTQTGATTNSLRFAAASARTLTLSGTNTLTSGGLLVSSGVGAFNNLITGGILRGASSADLIVHQNNAGGALTIASEIADNTAATALTKSGAGTLILSGTNTFTGSVFLNAGTLQLASAGALNTTTPNAVVFNNNSSARLQVFGVNAAVSSLTTSTVLANTAPIIENGSSTNSVLTVGNSTANTFVGTLQNGTGGGLLGLTKSGVGTLTLSGTNTFTGATTVSSGTLALTGNANLVSPVISVSSGATLDLTARTGGALALSSTQTLSGSGTVSGGITTVLGSTLVPGGNGNIDTLTASSLTVAGASILNFELANSGTGSDAITVSSASGLVLGGTGILVNLSPTTGGQFANGIGNTYTLFNYSGTLSGGGTSAGTILSNTFSVANPVGGLTYTFADTGSAITVTIGGSLANDATWQGGVDLSWSSAGNWVGGIIPQNSGDSARFGNAIGSTPTSITLDGSKTVALVEFNNAAGAYTLDVGTSGGLILNNGTSAGQVIVTSGTHTINAPLTLDSATTFGITGSGDSLTLTGDVGGANAITKTGAGLLALNGTSSQVGAVNLNGGTTSFVSGALGTAGALNFGGGTLRFATGNTEDISSARAISLLTGSGVFDTNGNDVTFAGIVQGTDGLTKAGTGILTLSGANTYAGKTTVNDGTLKIAANGNLGATPGVATPGNLTIGAGTLELSTSVTLAAARGVQLTSSSASIVMPAASTNAINGIITGTGKLNLSGAASLTLAGANTYSGGTLIDAGGLVTLNSGTALGTGQTELRDSQLTLNVATSTINNLLVATGKTGTVDGGVQIRPGVSGLNGAGDVTFLTRSGANDSTASGFGFRLQGSYTGFTGTLRLKSAIASTVHTFALHFNGGGFNGDLSNATVILSDYARLSGVNGSTGNTVTIGAISGDSTTILAGADYAGTNTYIIGTKNTDTTFDGLITNGSAGNAHLTKSGTGTLTLTGTNTYFGNTTVNSGTLAITNASALGSDTVGTTINGGDVNGRLAISGGLTITEPLTLGGRQGGNAGSAHVLNVAGNNQVTPALIPVTGGNSYNVQSDADLLTIAGGFTPAGAVTGPRILQVLGAGNGAWNGTIDNGTAVVSVIKNGAGTWTLSGLNTYTGDTTVDGGTLVISSTSQLKFAPTTNATSNKVAGTGAVTLDGAFNIDLTAANVLNGNSWLLVDVTNLTETYGANFTVPGFTQSGTNWTKLDGANTWTFSQTTGLLTLAVVTDPFVTWATTYFGAETNPAIIGKAADPDNDGLNNLAEFALNSAPNSSTNAGKIVGKVATVGSNDVLTLTLPVRNGATFTDDLTTHEEVSALTDGLIYRIQGTTDLSAWTLDVSEVGAGADLDAIQLGLPALETGWTYRTFRAPGSVSSSASDFLRVKVTE
jgi:fibronectin-binding autotransporter adhesin